MTPYTPSTTIRRATPVDLATLAFVALLWALAFIAIKLAVPALGPAGVALARSVIGCAVLAPFALGRGLNLPANAEQWWLVVAMSVLNVTLPFMAISWAELTIDAGVTSLLMGVGPLLAMVGAHYLNDGDRMTPRRLLGVGMGFGGILILVGVEALAGLGVALPAQAAVLGASLCYVIAGLLVRRIEVDTLSLSVLALGVAAATLVPIFFVTGPGDAPVTAQVVMVTLFLGIFPTGLAYILRFRLIRRIGYATFALGINLIPVFGVALGVVLLDEPVTVSLALALALVVGGLLVARSGS